MASTISADGLAPRPLVDALQRAADLDKLFPGSDGRDIFVGIVGAEGLSDSAMTRAPETDDEDRSQLSALDPPPKRWLNFGGVEGNDDRAAVNYRGFYLGVLMMTVRLVELGRWRRSEEPVHIEPTAMPA